VKYHKLLFFTVYRTSPVSTGGFGGLSPPKQSSKTPKWNMKHYQLVDFFSNLNVKPSLHERKVPLHKRKAPQLTTFWRRFCTELFRFRSKTGKLISVTHHLLAQQTVTWVKTSSCGSSRQQRMCDDMNTMTRQNALNFIQYAEHTLPKSAKMSELVLWLQIKKRSFKPTITLVFG